MIKSSISKFYFYLFVFAATLTLTGKATTLVHFDGTEIIGNFSTIRSADENDTLNLQYNFGTDNPSKMFNTGNNQLDFYGGYSFSAAADVSVVKGSPQLRQDEQGHASFSGAGDGTPTSSSMHVLYMWRQDQFLNGLDSGTVVFDESSTLSLAIGSWRDAPNARFLVREGSQYYISEAVHTSENSTFSLSDFNNNAASGSRWGLYAPTATDFDIPDVLPSFTAVDFQDITEVGFVVEGSRNNYHTGHGLTDFQVIAVPEPSSLLLFGIVGVTYLIASRRRRG